VNLSDCKKCYHHHGIAGDSVLCKYWKDLQYIIIMYDPKDGNPTVVGCPIDPDNPRE